MKTKNLLVLLAFNLVAFFSMAQTSIKMQVANLEKPTDVHNYNLSSVTITINKPTDRLVVDTVSVRTSYDDDDVRISFSLKNAPDSFIYQLMATGKTRFKGTITSTNEDEKNTIVYEFDQARIISFSNQRYLGESYGSTTPSIELTINKLKINGVPIEIYKEQ